MVAVDFGGVLFCRSSLWEVIFTMRNPLVETQLANAVLIARENIRAGKQAREYFDPPQLKELASSIREHGILQPLVVRYEPSRYDGSPYLLVAGERRFRASEGILDHLPCILQDADIATGKAISLIENLQRADLTAMEEAHGLQDLITSQNLSALRAAKVLHVSSGWVNNRLALLKTKPDVQAIAAKKPLAMSSLLMIDGVKDSELRSELLNQVEGGAAHSEIKARIELHKRPQHSEFPDSETARRQGEYSRNGTPNVSRGLALKGSTPKEAQTVVSESLQFIETKADTIEAWIETLSDSQRAKLLPRFKRLATRFEAIAK